MNIALSSTTQRQISIDAFRAITLILMIFVNDHWTLVNIPSWLEHADANKDAMGFADVIFPAFLFIVGLSIPFAIQSRLKKQPSFFKIELHIISRALALLIIGFFHVNMGNYSHEAVLPAPLWKVLATIAFFLIWLDYPTDGKHNYWKVLKVIGVVLLVILAFLYKGTSADGPVWMQTKWWGILGLIGWTYLIVSSVYLLSRDKLWVMVVAFLFFVLFNAATQLGWLDMLKDVSKYIWIVGDGSMPALAAAGVISSMLYRNSSVSYQKFWIFTLLSSIALIAFGFATRPLWGISKIRATPSWVTICIGISLVAFAVMIYLTEIKGYKRWYTYVKAAGSITLTCYLLPYLHNVFLELVPYRLPVELRTGIIGLFKSMTFALCIVFIGNLLEKWRIRLKL
jgi:predicted acyltransferase